MTTILKRILLLVPLAFLFPSASFSAAIGAEITYRCLDSSGNYEVTLVYYKDCSTGPICAGSDCNSLGGCSKTIEVYGGDPAYINTKFTSFAVTGVSLRDVFQSKNCSGAKSICDNMGCESRGFLSPGYERYEFKGTVNIGGTSAIPAACCNIRFTFNECCRNTSIQSFNSANSNYYTDAVVNRCAATYPNCNSAVFTNEPFFTVESSSPYFFNHGANDPDHDSLVYSFTPSLEAYNTSVTYNPPYSYDFPMNYTSGPAVYPFGMSCDRVNGNVYFKPNSNVFTGSIAIRVDQYRYINNNPTLVGIVRRDLPLQVNGSGIPNNQPLIKTNPPGSPVSQPKTFWEVCAGNTICFDVVAKDTDITDTTYLSWNKELEALGATFTPNYTEGRDTSGPREDTYKFCWTPHDSVANKINNVAYYYFTVKAEDNKCPYAGTMLRSFTIRVLPKADVSIAKTQLDCNKWKLSYVKNPAISPVQSFTSVQWKIANDTSDWSFANGSTTYSNIQTTPVLNFSKTGKYLVQLSINMQGPSNGTCPIVYYDTITVIKSLDVRTSNDTTMCKTGNALIISTTKTDPEIDLYRWYALPDTTNVLVTQDHFNLNANKSASYLLRAIDIESGCNFSDTTNIQVAGLRVQFSINNNQQCKKGNSFVFTNQSADTAGNTISYLWTNSAGDTSLGASGFTRSYTNPGSYMMKLRMQTTFGCKDSISKPFEVFFSPAVNFSFANDSVQCLRTNSFSFLNNSSAGPDGLIYNWYFANAGTSNAINPSGIVFPSAGTPAVKLVATTTSHACQDSLTKTVKVNPNPNASFIVNNPAQCRRNNLFQFTNFSSISSGTLSQIWQFGDGGTSVLSSPGYAYNTSGNFNVKLKVTSNLGCKDSMTTPVEVFAQPLAFFAANDSEQCTGFSFVFTNQTQLASGNYTSSWDFGDGNSSAQKDVTKSYSSAGNYVVELKTVSDHQCRDSASKNILVSDKPAAPVITGDTFAFKHGSKAYSVVDHPGSLYYWTITGDSAHTINQNTATVYWGISDSGKVAVFEDEASTYCMTDTVFVKVRIVPNVGMNELTSADQITLYPQPATDKLHLKGAFSELRSAELISMEGKTLLKYSIEEIQSGTLHISEIPTGVYIIQFTDANNQRLLKKVSVIR